MTTTKQNFLVAVQGYPDWYQAGKNSLDIGALGLRINNLDSAEYSAVLSGMISTNPTIKAELAANVAKASLAEDANVQKKLSALHEEELIQRCRHIDLDKEEELFNKYGDEELDRLESDLTFMRSLDDSDYRHTPTLDRILRLSAAMDILAPMVAEPQEGAEASLTTFLQGLKDNDLVSIAEQLLPVRLSHYTRNSLMSHWEQAGRTLNGKCYDGFMILGQRFVHKDAVEKITPQP